MERFCLVSFPSFSAPARMPRVQFRRGGGTGLPQTPTVLKAWGLPAPPQRPEDLRARAGTALSHLLLTGMLVTAGWHGEHKSTHPRSLFCVHHHPRGPLTYGEGKCRALYIPPTQWPAPSTGSDTLSSLLNHAQLRHNLLQLSFTWILVVFKYLWYGWDSLLISTKEIRGTSKHFYSDKTDFAVVNSCLPNSFRATTLSKPTVFWILHDRGGYKS